MEEPEVHNNKGSQSEKTVHCNPRLHGIPENSKTTEILKCLLVSKVYVCGGGRFPYCCRPEAFKAVNILQDAVMGILSICQKSETAARADSCKLWILVNNVSVLFR